MAQYPGQNTEFFIVINDVVTGPLVGLSELLNYHVTPDTPVWYQGLDDWKPAFLAPLTSQLFSPNSEFFRATAKNDKPEEFKPQVSDLQPNPIVEEQRRLSRPQPAQTTISPAANIEAPHIAVDAQTFKPPRPYLIWAIVTAVIFNFICGLIAIIYSFKVKSKIRQGNIDGAARCSNFAQWWIAVGICIGLIITFAQLFIRF